MRLMEARTVSKMILVFGLLVLVACSKTESPILAHLVHAKSLYDQEPVVKSYEIPQGILRGALWPSSAEGNFRIWLVQGKKDVFFDIPAPQGFDRSIQEVTEEWDFKAYNRKQDRVMCLASRKDGKKTIEIDLPLRKRPYSFFALANPSGSELVVLMDMSENVTDRGLFGYVVVDQDK